ncbi:MAG: GNAT family N-acetyltransferase [Porticoccaceae bacterium]
MATTQIFPTTWAEHAAEIMAVRTTVFIVEQQVPEELEFDQADHSCQHWLAINHLGQAVGTARMLDGGHIGRMAVLRNYRQQGIGHRIMHSVIAWGRQNGQTRLQLSAQRQAQAFYASLGFVAYGEEFMDAGIPHIAMALDLAVN